MNTSVYVTVYELPDFAIYSSFCVGVFIVFFYVDVLARYNYYNMKIAVSKFSSILPKEFSWLAYSLGWCAKAVDSVADRILFDGFAGDDFSLNEIYKLNISDGSTIMLFCQRSSLHAASSISSR